jgi:phage head maturation protease
MDRIELRAKFDKEKLEFTGLVNNYQKSKVLTRNGKKFREIISRKVFEEALDKKPDIKLFVNHQPYVDVAESIEVVAEEKGLIAKVKLLENAKGLFDGIKSNEFGQWSYVNILDIKSQTFLCCTSC